MQIGIRFPTLEIGTDLAIVRDWALAAAELGFAHIAVSDHVLGVDPRAWPEYGALFPDTNGRGPYVLTEPFHEPMVMLGYLAALCPDLQFSTGVMIAPQRQTVLLAKQAAQADFLCRGRLRLGIGVGWNPVEYQALGVDFHTRGRRIEEQITTMRALWTQETVHIDGEFDRVIGAGLFPRPVQQPIPLWIGGYVDRALDRIGRVADGWHAGDFFPKDMQERLDRIAIAAARAGRDPGSIGLEGAAKIRPRFAGLDEDLARWEQIGATHLLINPMQAGYESAQHLQFIEQIAERLPLKA